MESLFYNISQVLGIAIVHSLWQGLLLWFLLRIAFISAPRLSSVQKYNMAAAAMLGIAAWFIVTLFNEAGNFNWHPAANAPAKSFVPQPGLVNQLSPFKAQADRYYYVIEGYLPYVSVLYLAGLLINLLKLSYCRVKLYQIKKALLPAGDMQWLADDFSERLGIRRYVKVNFSSLVDVPCMIGYLKPIILLPLSLAANLSVAETEAILLHELAHIKRNDYLVNLLQQIINSLLFFNPFAQLINRLISSERENCCDDLVVQTTNNPLVYARALLKLEESRQTNLQLALAATTKKHYLLTRIERIMKTQQKIGNIRHLVLAILLLAGSLSSIAWLNPEIKNGKVTIKAIKPTEIINTLLFTDTTRKKATKAVYKTKSDAAAIRKTKKEGRTYYSYGDGEYYTEGMKDPELEKLSTEVQKYGEAINKYYDSEEFKAYSTDIEKRGKEIDAFYNSDKIKQLTAAQEQLGKEYEKKWGGDNNGMEKIGHKMEALGKKMEAYFGTPEFKATDDHLRKKYNITSKYNDSRDENYKKYQDELNSTLSPEIKETTEQMKKLGEEMRNVYGAGMRKDGDRMRIMGDSMRKAFNNPAIKQQHEEMRKISEKMRAYTNNPEMKKQQEMLRAASDKLRAYTNSPEFKAKVKEWKKTRQVYRWNSNNDDKDFPTPPTPPAAPSYPPAPNAPSSVTPTTPPTPPTPPTED